MKYVLDRIEGSCAVLECEDGKELIVSKNELPLSAKEGDVVKHIGGNYIVDTNETENRKNKLNEKMKKLTKK